MFRLSVLLSLFLIFSNNLFSQCFKNKVNCSYGCGRHVDANNDGYCDYTEFTADILQKLNAKIDTQINKNLPENDSIKKTVNKIKENISEKLIFSHTDTCKGKTNFNSSEKKIVESTVTLKSNIEEKNKDKTVSSPNNKTKPYDLIFISFLTIILYITTLLLVKLGKLKKYTHRKIWNMSLLLTFIVSCIFGFFLVIQINYNILMPWLPTILYWHVEIGIAMTLISFFHIWWHLKYFKNIIKNNKTPDIIEEKN